MSILEQNVAKIIGRVSTEPVLSHTVYGENFYTFDVEVNRLSAADDIVPVLISEKLMKDVTLGAYVSVDGQIRTHNRMIDNSRKLIIYIFTIDITLLSEEAYATAKTTNNEITIEGFICKKPVYRKTPFGREIADLLVAVNRSYRKSDYIPCIAWGRNAKYAGNFEVGQKVQITARFQSRLYQKKQENGELEDKLAYELSVLNVKALS